MGQQRARRLNLVAASASGEPITIELGEKSAKRLAGLLYASQGAELAAKAAEQQHAALRTQYETAIVGVLEAHGVEQHGGVNHDVDKSLITVQPAPPAEAAPV
jgi:hypothetical protein